jgi:hypothetical protein
MAPASPQTMSVAAAIPVSLTPALTRREVSHLATASKGKGDLEPAMREFNGRALLSALVLVGVLLAVAYAAAPAILSAVVMHTLTGVVEVHKLQIASVGPTRLRVAIVDVDSGQMRFDARDAVIRYDLWPFRIRGIDIKRAHLGLGAVSTGAPAQSASFPMPPFALRIGLLTVQASTPWGALTIPASILTKAGPAGGLVAEIRTADFLISLTNPEPDRQALRLLGADGTLLLSLAATWSRSYPVRFDGRLNPEATVGRLMASPDVPSGLKASLRPFKIHGDELRLNGTLQRDLDLSGNLQGSLAVSDQREVGERVFDNIEVDAPVGYEITRAGTSWSGSGDAALRVAVNSDTTLTGRNPAWHWGKDGFAFSATTLYLEQLGLSADQLDITSPEPAGSAIQGDIRVKALRAATWPKELPPYDLSGRWSLRGTAFQASGNGQGTSLPRLNWDVETAGTRGFAEVTVHGPLAPLSPGMREYAANTIPELKIAAGNLDGRYRLQWTGTGRQASLSATAAPVDADADQLRVRGMKIKVENRGNSIHDLSVAVSAPTLQLGAGVEGQQAQLRLSLAYPQVTVDSARIKLFDGEITLRPTSLDLHKRTFVLVADVDSVSLKSIIKLLDLESMELTGKVSGPVRVVYDKEQGLAIDPGDLHNVGPGVLKLSVNDNSHEPSQFSDLALQALKNLHYNELKASLVYKPDGQYRIAARIVGSNPNVLGGHTIALNPTITGRLPALFRAFFITGDFDRAIIETLQKEKGLRTR